MTAVEFAQLVKRPRRRADGVWWDSQCPAHDDQRASLSLRDGDRGLVVDCHVGCAFQQIAATVGRKPSDFFHDANGHPPPRTERRRALGAQRREQMVYDYVDETGTLLFQVVRFAPKDFRQRRPDGDGWIWNLKGVRLVLYRLGDLATLRPARVYVVEGEKDADALWALDLPATTSPGGAGKWKREFTAQLQACGIADAVLLPDHDDGGRAHMRTVAASLVEIGLGVRWLDLPVQGQGEDFTDWSTTYGGTKAALLRQVEALPEWTPPAAAGSDAHDPRPFIHVEDQDLPRANRAAWDALEAENRPEPVLFESGGLIARVARVTAIETAGVAWRQEPVTEAVMRGQLARVARFTTTSTTKRGAQIDEVYPPQAVVRDVLAFRRDLPPLRRIVTWPILAADGTIQDRPGYSRATATWYAPSPGFALPRPVPAAPTAAELTEARAPWEELLTDFRFATEADQATAYALGWLPFGRDLIDGPTPLHDVEAAVVGAGKGLLVRALLLPALGEEPPSTPAPRSEEEWGKTLVAHFVSGGPVFALDNVGGEGLLSEALALALTQPVYEGRLLGGNTLGRWPVRTIWCATANNPTVTTELVRRMVRCRLDATDDQPWLRDPDSPGADPLAAVRQAVAEANRR